MKQSSISQPITEIILNHIENSGLSDRKWAESVGLSHPMIGRFREGTAMGIDTLELIVTKYPELKDRIAGIFGQKETATPVGDAAVTIKKLSDSISALTQANLVNAQTIAQLLSREVVKEG